VITMPISMLESRTVVLPADNIDTDQIIPARFLTTTSREGLGRHLFADWRYDREGAPYANFVLNRPEAGKCEVLVAGRNFGCGSSREHAVWALLDYGFRAVVSCQIADIFRANATRNGLLPIIVDPVTHSFLLARPYCQVRIDLYKQTLSASDGPTATFPFDPFARHCHLRGVDELGFLLSQSERIHAHETRT
jgi:3-isopropylmalate/(R)-2-methylmalate dehydratase small subunit